MPKQLSKGWRDGLDMALHCRVIKAQLANPGHMQLLLEDPAGQKFALIVEAKVNPSMAGDILKMEATFAITALEMDEVLARTFDVDLGEGG